MIKVKKDRVVIKSDGVAPMMAEFTHVCKAVYEILTKNVGMAKEDAKEFVQHALDICLCETDEELLHECMKKKALELITGERKH